MYNTEIKRVEMLSDWYLKEQLDFDKCLIEYRYKKIKSYLNGPSGLELGPADGQMTQFLINDFSELTIVDGAKELLDQIPERLNLKKIHKLFEEYNPDKLFDTIIMEHILEHIESPSSLLKIVMNWLKPDGKIIIGVPNGNSIHRLVAVKMGLLNHQQDLNNRDLSLGHRRVYTSKTLEEEITAVGLNIEILSGIFFKPLSNQQIQNNWSKDMMDGFYKLGDDFPEYAAELYAVCKLNV